MQHPRPLPTALALVLGALFATAADAQQDLEALAKKRDKKLESAFLETAPWTTDYDEARAQARKSKRPIFAYFTRSYAP